MPYAKKVGVQKVSWMAVKNILVKLATVITYYSHWRLLKMSQKEISKGCGVMGTCAIA